MRCVCVCGGGGGGGYCISKGCSPGNKKVHLRLAMSPKCNVCMYTSVVGDC